MRVGLSAISPSILPALLAGHTTAERLAAEQREQLRPLTDLGKGELVLILEYVTNTYAGDTSYRAATPMATSHRERIAEVLFALTAEPYFRLPRHDLLLPTPAHSVRNREGPVREVEHSYTVSLPFADPVIDLSTAELVRASSVSPLGPRVGSHRHLWFLTGEDIALYDSMSFHDRQVYGPNDAQFGKAAVDESSALEGFPDDLVARVQRALPAKR